MGKIWLNRTASIYKDIERLETWRSLHVPKFSWVDGYGWDGCVGDVDAAAQVEVAQFIAVLCHHSEGARPTDYGSVLRPFLLGCGGRALHFPLYQEAATTTETVNRKRNDPDRPLAQYCWAVGTFISWWKLQRACCTAQSPVKSCSAAICESTSTFVHKNRSLLKTQKSGRVIYLFYICSLGNKQPCWRRPWICI